MDRPRERHVECKPLARMRGATHVLSVATPSRVLVLVPNPELAASLVDALREAGHSAFVAGERSTAIAAARRERFDATLIDADERDAADAIGANHAGATSTLIVSLAAHAYATTQPSATPSRRVLLALDDPAYGELIADALTEAGHQPSLADEPGALGARLAAQPFDVAVIDLDTRARNGASLIAAVREASPDTTVIALLPCGGRVRSPGPLRYHIAIEKPTRLASLLLAIAISRPVVSR
jgi:DNA-binding response OmpR family regulator